MPTIKAKKPSVPAGSYLARFAGIEDIETKYGEGIRWIFEVLCQVPLVLNNCERTVKQPETCDSSYPSLVLVRALPRAGRANSP